MIYPVQYNVCFVWHFAIADVHRHGSKLGRGVYFAEDPVGGYQVVGGSGQKGWNYQLPGWWFQNYFLFSSLFEETIKFD